MTRLRYPPKTDILFKMFFTQNVPLLRSFLAAALALPKESIHDIEFMNSELLPETVYGKTCRVDLNLKVDAQVVDVEIQVENEQNFRERPLFYGAKLFTNTLNSGGNYKMASLKTSVFRDEPLKTVSSIAVGILGLKTRFRGMLGLKTRFRGEPIRGIRKTLRGFSRCPKPFRKW